MRLHIKCPNCGSPSKASQLRRLSPVLTEILYNCTHPGCGAGFVGAFAVSRFLKLPLNLDPTLNIPLSPLVQKRQRHAMVADSSKPEPAAAGEIKPAGIPATAERGPWPRSRAKPSSQANANTGLPASDTAKPLEQPEAVPATAPASTEASPHLGHWRHLF